MRGARAPKIRLAVLYAFFSMALPFNYHFVQETVLLQFTYATGLSKVYFLNQFVKGKLVLIKNNWATLSVNSVLLTGMLGDMKKNGKKKIFALSQISMPELFYH